LRNGEFSRELLTKRLLRELRSELEQELILQVQRVFDAGVGYLTEEDLQQVYRHAKAVLVPSVIEGFGIPLLEAMASGTPVISSNATSLPEVGGNTTEYLDPTNVNEMAQAIGAVLGNARSRLSMMQRGLAQTEKFNPDVISQRVAKFWKELQTGAADN
jgi:glycosyltransferase involved in cell wall biosynthesis